MVASSILLHTPRIGILIYRFCQTERHEPTGTDNVFEYSFNGPDLAMILKLFLQTFIKLYVKHLTVTLEKTIPVAVKNNRG